MKKLLIIALSLSLMSVAYATSDKAGTGGAQFLKIGAGARPTGMGDSFVAISDDLNAVYFNPAGIATISRPEFTAMHTQWLADTNYDFGAFSYPTNHGAFAVSAATLKVQDIQRRDVNETHSGDFKAMDSAYALSYGHNLTPLFSMGLTGRYIQQSIDSTSAQTWAADIGLIKRFENSPLSIGLAARHLGKPVEFRNESDPLPTTVDLGFALPIFRQKLLVTADGRWLRDNDPGYGAGLEYRNGLGEKGRFALRAGYNSTATDSEGSGVTLGGGFGFKRLDLDFAWVPFGDLGNTFRYAARLKF